MTIFKRFSYVCGLSVNCESTAGACATSVYKESRFSSGHREGLFMLCKTVGTLYLHLVELDKTLVIRVCLR